MVFIQHGVTDCSVGFVLNGPKQSLPYILADAGFDVWLGNNRGNGISMTNSHYSPSDDGFWNFTWDEMAAIDFPTQVEYVLSQTGAKQLSYIGHSQVHSFGVQRRKSYRFRALYRLSQVWSTTLMWPANSIFSWL